MRQPLDKALRRTLESTVIKARDIAEQAATQALEQLGVGDAKVADFLNDDQRSLRNRLRARGRQLGDVRHTNGQQDTKRLITEIAYEHWHRMLFARFLEQNNLLMYDEYTALTLAECHELAQEPEVARDDLERQCKDGWDLAGVLASKMLPQVFRINSPVFEIQFAPEHQRSLEQLIMNLDTETFKAQDSLGWVYQFWQSKRKDEVNNSGVKIGADELSPVTQLFTEPYMVSFLLDNALGAWWSGKKLTDSDWQNAKDEQELRDKAAIDGVPLEYLRFVQDENSKQWQPASGTFDAWPDNLSEFKAIDPCCGSGHFLVAIFLMLVPMRMQLENLNEQQAIDKVLSENLHGLELDQRCVELAAFAVALEAWRYPNAGGYRKLPELHLACSGLSVTAARDEWKALSREADKQNLSIALDQMYQTFKDAPVLGSLINPRRSDAAKIADWDDLQQLLSEALSKESQSTGDSSEHNNQVEAGIVAQGLAKAAELLSDRYSLVITNVPYLKAGDQCDTLKQFINKHYPLSKYALEATFIERCHEFLNEGGCSAVVTQQYWLFLKYYNLMRERFIRTKNLGLIARLGTGAFEEISGEVVNVCLQLTFNGFSDTHYGLDVSESTSTDEKAVSLINQNIKAARQKKQLDNPDYRISFEIDSSFGQLLSSYADFGKGSVSGDGPHYIRKFWEFEKKITEARFWINSPNHEQMFSGRQDFILWGGSYNPTVESGFRHHGHRVHNKKGVAIGKAGSFRFTPYTGEIFDDNVAVLLPLSKKDLNALWYFAISGNLQEEIKKLDKKMSVTAGTFTKVRVDIDKLRAEGSKLIPKGLPEPYTNDPTQWIFHGHPCGSVIWDEKTKWTTKGELRVDDSVLQVAVARLLGYQWPAELDSEMELAVEQRQWVKRSQELNQYADDDGIVCLAAIRGEKSADQRLEALLQAAYGEAWTSLLRDELLALVKGKSLKLWLRDKFFEQHCKMFQHRPFIWHIWDGLNDGFSALVNYHKLDKAGLERLIYTYLGDWIRTQQSGIANGEDGAQERLSAAEALKKELEAILEGEAPYDIFVRWKSLEEQPVGWTPDLNDGVRLNIRPFMLAKDVGRKGAGILRWKPNIHWKKDRGKDVESATWYQLGLEYEGKEGDRINEHHLSLKEKLATRGQG